MCHPCAGAMLIFSVSLQISYMCCRSKHNHTIRHLDKENLVTSKAAFACGGTELPVICSFYWLPSCSARWLQQVLARCNLSQISEIYAKPYPLAVWRRCALPGHLRLLKIWNTPRISTSSLRRGHANLRCIVPILIYVLP